MLFGVIVGQAYTLRNCTPFNTFLNSMYPNIWTNSTEFQDIETALQDFSTQFILCEK